MGLRFKIHLCVAGLQLLLAYPAVRWWSHSILFVIGISLFANFYAAISAVEASDDSTVLAELASLRELIERGQQNTEPVNDSSTVQTSLETP